METRLSPKSGLLHVPKTGGTSVKRLVERVQPTQFVVFPHQKTARQVWEESPDCQLAVVVRDPIERFVSAFYSRLRSGRPAHDSTWSAAEAAAFLWFEDVNDLAEAITHRSERWRSAAYFACRKIPHLAGGYRRYLHSEAFVRRNEARLYFACELSELSSRTSELLRDDYDGNDTERHHVRVEDPPLLSDTSRHNLEMLLEAEYQIVSALREQA